MTRTIKVRYEGEPGFAAFLADQRRRQGRMIRSANERLVGGLAQKDLIGILRAHPVGLGLHTWLVLSGMKWGAALQARFPEGGIVFGCRRAQMDRAQGRLSPGFSM
jgi:hypothetical protein